MEIIGNYNECIERRLQSGQPANIVSLAESQGVAALASVPPNNEFYLLTIDNEVCSWYRCKNKFSRLVIIYTKEALTHKLNGSEDFDQNLKKLICVNEKKNCAIFLDAESFSQADRLKTSLEKLFDEVRAMPKSDGVDVKGKFCAPDIELRFSENCSMKILDFYRPISPFHISLDENTLQQQLVDEQTNKLSGVTLRSVIPDTNPDYKVGDLGIKVVTIRADVDGYQNVYLTVRGIDKKEKTTLIYSRYPQKQSMKEEKVPIHAVPEKKDANSKAASKKKIIDKIARKQKYSIKTDGNLGVAIYAVLDKFIREMRRCIKAMYESSYPDQDWFEAYKNTISADDVKLKNLEKSEKTKRETGDDLISLIDYQYLMTVMVNEKDNILHCWKIRETDYKDLKDHIYMLTNERNGLCHFNEKTTPKEAMDGVGAACSAAMILEFKSYQDLLDDQSKVACAVNENYKNKCNKQL